MSERIQKERPVSRHSIEILRRMNIRDSCEDFGIPYPSAFKDMSNSACAKYEALIERAKGIHDENRRL